MSIRSFFKPKEAAQALSTVASGRSTRSTGKHAATADSSDQEPADKPAKKAKTLEKDSDTPNGTTNGTAEVEPNETAVNSQSASPDRKNALPPDVLEAIQKKKELALERKRAKENETAASGGAAPPTAIPGAPKTILEAANLLPPSWKELLASEFSKDYFKSLSDFVKSEQDAGKKVYPPIPEVFSAFHLCPLDSVSVVIVGQDPYHGPGQAHGLAFSVQRGVPPPPSLLNMYKELEQDPGVPGFRRPAHGCLAGWAQQGVFMLNAVLTVRHSEPNSHQRRGWETFTDAVIALLNRRGAGIVFLLWGKPAEAKCKAVDGKRHVIFKAAHPSPLSAMRGFMGCGHFSKVNQHLKAIGRPTIDWQV